MTQIAPGIRFVDVNFLGVPQVIATAVLQGPGGVALVDPGPSTTLHTLRTRLGELGLAIGDLTDLVLTHIHLDHAGASGALVRENPQLRVFVHERGARHLVDPSRLLESASRLYGDQMQWLWGEVLPLPAANVRALAGGERIEAGGRALDVAYTPGHAFHHVCYFDAAGGVAFVGDTAGVRIGGSTFIMPPTPPPDIDLDLWAASVERILAWRPASLFLTHFGPNLAGVEDHLRALIDRLRVNAGLARAVLDEGGPDAAQVARFKEQAAAELRRHVTEAEARSFELAVPLDHCYMGLARYWRKQAAGAQTPASVPSQ